MQGSKKDHEPTEICDAKKILFLCKTESKPQNNTLSYHSPPPCWVSLSTPGKIKGATLWGAYICPPGIPYLVKSTEAVNGIHIRETKEAKLKGCNADPGARGGTPIHNLYGYVPPNGVVILKLLI